VGAGIGGIGAGGGSLRASDLVVSDAPEGFAGGVALAAYEGASVEVDRVRIDRARAVGVLVTGAASMTGRDLVVRDTSAGLDGNSGVAIAVQRESHGIFERVLVARSSLASVALDSAGSTLEARDLRIATTRGAASDGTWGMGLFANAGSMTVERALVEDSASVGAFAYGGAVVTLRDVALRGIRGSDCAATTCPMWPAGFGLGTQEGGAITATAFEVTDASLCGVVVGASSGAPCAIDLHDGTLARAPIGACVQVDGYDTARLRDRVAYVDVATPLQATSYDLPDPPSL
jgi:hypothetical protein